MVIDLVPWPDLLIVQTASTYRLLFFSLLVFPFLVLYNYRPGPFIFSLPFRELFSFTLFVFPFYNYLIALSFSLFFLFPLTPFVNTHIIKLVHPTWEKMCSHYVCLVLYFPSVSALCPDSFSLYTYFLTDHVLTLSSLRLSLFQFILLSFVSPSSLPFSYSFVPLPSTSNHVFILTS